MSGPPALLFSAGPGGRPTQWRNQSDLDWVPRDEAARSSPKAASSHLGLPHHCGNGGQYADRPGVPAACIMFQNEKGTNARGNYSPP
jgi:hypothetical protein